VLCVDSRSLHISYFFGLKVGLFRVHQICHSDEVDRFCSEMVWSEAFVPSMYSWRILSRSSGFAALTERLPDGSATLVPEPDFALWLFSVLARKAIRGSIEPALFSAAAAASAAFTT